MFALNERRANFTYSTYWKCPSTLIHIKRTLLCFSLFPAPSDSMILQQMSLYTLRPLFFDGERRYVMKRKNLFLFRKTHNSEILFQPASLLFETNNNYFQCSPQKRWLFQTTVFVQSQKCCSFRYRSALFDELAKIILNCFRFGWKLKLFYDWKRIFYKWCSNDFKVFFMEIRVPIIKWKQQNLKSLKFKVAWEHHVTPFKNDCSQALIKRLIPGNKAWNSNFPFHQSVVGLKKTHWWKLVNI